MYPVSSFLPFLVMAFACVNRPIGLLLTIVCDFVTVLFAGEISGRRPSIQPYVEGMNLNLSKHFSSFLLATCHLGDNSVTKYNWNEFPIPQGTLSIVRLFSHHKELHLVFATNKGTLHDLGSAFCKKFAVIDSNSDFVTLMQGPDFNFCDHLSSFVFATAALVTTPQTNTTDEPSFPSFATEHTLPLISLISMNIWEMVVSFSGFCWIWLKGRNKGLVEFFPLDLVGYFLEAGQSGGGKVYIFVMVWKELKQRKHEQR
ncbi:hypothetical protein M0R45_020165 [Rubus argutus]|uniref:Uncharacterized protein n=1 Tax=Rubus argutus TaxID=59490 RepID=A0AAW1X9M2_RUBAR